MTARLLISVRPGEVRGALVRDGRMVWYDFLRTLHEETPPPPVGTVFLARVRKVEPGLQAAFVELEGGSAALLGARDAKVLARPGTDGRLPIEKLVHEGQAVLVQISRASRDGKGPRVTADLALPGADGKPVLPRRDGETPAWAEIQERARTAKPPALLWQPPTPDPAVALWRAAPARAEAVETDHQPTALVLRRALEQTGCNTPVTDTPEDIFAAHGLDDEVAALSGPVAGLQGGASLIIESTAALTAIDVNAGGALGSTGGDTALKVNLAAAREIPRQISLRRLGGVIVTDFLRMKAARHRKEVIAALRQGMEDHGLQAQISGFSPAGLVEIVLPRHALIRGRLTSPCPQCAGRGDIPAIAGHALALLHRVAQEARRGGAPLIEARAAPEVIAWIEARPDGVARELAHFAVTAPLFRAEPGWPPDRIDVRPCAGHEDDRKRRQTKP